MTWWRDLLAHFHPPVMTGAERVRDLKVRKSLNEADKVIKAYRDLDGVLKLYVERRK